MPYLKKDACCQAVQTRLHAALPCSLTHIDQCRLGLRTSPLLSWGSRVCTLGRATVTGRTRNLQTHAVELHVGHRASRSGQHTLKTFSPMHARVLKFDYRTRSGHTGTSGIPIPVSVTPRVAVHHTTTITACGMMHSLLLEIRIR